MIRHISKKILSLFGWKLQAELPTEKKYLIIGAPHTSNWDFPLAIIALAAMGLKFSWVGKHTLFRFPFGYFFKALGGIPVDRHVRQSFIHKIIALFSSSDTLILAIAPEGTRAKTAYWKTGFYSIAVEAGVPVALGFLDYSTKTIGVGATFFPSRRIEEDFRILQKFYSEKTGKYPDKQGPVQLRQKEIARYRTHTTGEQAQDAPSAELPQE